MTWSRVPVHLLAASLCSGLVVANVSRTQTVALAGSLLAAVAVVAVQAPVSRLALTAVFLVFVGWWWGSARLDSLDRSPMLDEVGRAGRALVVVITPPTHGRFDLRAQGVLRRFEGAAVGERVQLELPLGQVSAAGCRYRRARCGEAATWS